MLTITTLFLALTFGSEEMEIARPAVYTVNFRNTAGYPVEANLGFATRAEAEAFAAMKANHGYAVRVVRTR